MLCINKNNWIKNIQHCALCGCPRPDPQGLCADCHADLPWLLTPCPRCALPLPSAARGLACAHCLRQPPAFAQTLAAFRYDFPLSQLLPYIKYQRQPAHLGWLGRVLAAFLQPRVEAWPEALVPVPMHPRAERRRGFNQARLLAEVLARQLGLPLHPCVHKVRATPQQMALDLRQRQHNLRQAFAVVAPPPRHLALIDDVMTTGTTANRLAEQLRAAGAERVDVWVLARTPEVR